MQLTITAKQLGQKRPLISNRQIEIEDIGLSPTVKQLIQAVVTQQVGEYNAKPLEKSLLPFLEPNSIDDGAARGKIGFGSVYNENKADLSAAVQIALQALDDGLFVIFVNEHEFKEQDAIISLQDNPIVSFVRLTFLSGSYW